uniref:ER membrane protein complex subunit 8 n=2 Tax=Myripristis murdjan TaxID=586833 RepID=A0A667YEK5_9TELE
MGNHCSVCSATNQTCVPLYSSNTSEIPLGREALHWVDPHVQHPLQLLLFVLGIKSVGDRSVHCNETTTLSKALLEADAVHCPVRGEKKAYCKMLLHAAKYPHCAVNGLLVAEKVKEKKKDSHSAPILCVDCVPLFHGTLALAPMLEVALTLIDTWCKENRYVIAGYYQANERTKDFRPNQVAEKVAARISENFSEAAIVMVDNSRLTMSCFEPIVLIYDHHENKWKSRDVNTDCFEDWLEAQKITSALLEGRSYENLIDFDNHLDDLRNDWTNPVINKSVLDLC